MASLGQLEQLQSTKQLKPDLETQSGLDMFSLTFLVCRVLLGWFVSGFVLLFRWIWEVDLGRWMGLGVSLRKHGTALSPERGMGCLSTVFTVLPTSCHFYIPFVADWDLSSVRNGITWFSIVSPQSMSSRSFAPKSCLFRSLVSDLAGL